MKFKGEENKVLWESYLDKNLPQDDSTDNLEFDDSIEGDDEFGDQGFENDLGDDGLGDSLGGPEAEGMVMEIDPVGPVEPHEVNEELVMNLKKLAEYSKRLYEMKDSAEFEEWQITAITVASAYVTDVWHRLDAKVDFANTGFEQADDFEQF